MPDKPRHAVQSARFQLSPHTPAAAPSGTSFHHTGSREQKTEQLEQLEPPSVQGLRTIIASRHPCSCCQALRQLAVGVPSLTAAAWLGQAWDVLATRPALV